MKFRSIILLVLTVATCAVVGTLVSLGGSASAKGETACVPAEVIADRVFDARGERPYLTGGDGRTGFVLFVNLDADTFTFIEAKRERSGAKVGCPIAAGGNLEFWGDGR